MIFLYLPTDMRFLFDAQSALFISSSIHKPNVKQRLTLGRMGPSSGPTYNTFQPVCAAVDLHVNPWRAVVYP